MADDAPEETEGVVTRDKISRVERFNASLGSILAVAAKFLTLVLGVILGFLVIAEVWQSNVVTIGEFEVPERQTKQRNNGKVFASNVAQKINERTKIVPIKLKEMFISEYMSSAEKERLSNTINAYALQKTAFEVKVKLGVFDLRVDHFFNRLRGLFGMEVKEVQGIVTIHDNTLRTVIAILADGIQVDRAVFTATYSPNMKNSFDNALDTVADKAALFILKNNEPLAVLLQDFQYMPEYSSGRAKSWQPEGSPYDEKRISALRGLTKEGSKESSRTKVIAHAILGDLLQKRNACVGDNGASEQYEKAVQSDPTFVATVGISWANCVIHGTENPGWRDFEQAEHIYRKMLRLEPGNNMVLDHYLALLDRQRQTIESDNPEQYGKLVRSYETLANMVRTDLARKNEVLLDLAKLHGTTRGRDEEFYLTFQQALHKGAQLDEHRLKFDPYPKYAGESRFQKMTQGLSKDASPTRIPENLKRAIPEGTRQVILASSSGPGVVPVQIRTFEPIGGGLWEPVFPPMAASGGWKGFAPLGQKEEGDGRVPSGVYRIKTSFGYRPRVDTKLTYVRLQRSDFWIDDPKSRFYNQWVRLVKTDDDDRYSKKMNAVTYFNAQWVKGGIDVKGEAPRESHEVLMRNDHLYYSSIVIEYNVDPILKGKGSAIFIHWERSPGASTTGCIATSRGNLLNLFRWLDVKKHPVIIMGTEGDLQSRDLHASGR